MLLSCIINLPYLLHRHKEGILLSAGHKLLRIPIQPLDWIVLDSLIDSLGVDCIRFVSPDS